MSEFSYEKILEQIREKVFFYVSYQKRTEFEVKQKFNPVLKKYNISTDILIDLIEELKDKGYIDDKDFVRRKFIAYTNLKLTSLKEIKYKIMQKGIAKDLIEEYIQENKEKLEEYQKEAVKKIYAKKSSEGKTNEEIKENFRKKGFKEDAIKEIDNINL